MDGVLGGGVNQFKQTTPTAKDAFPLFCKSVYLKKVLFKCVGEVATQNHRQKDTTLV